MIRIAAVAFVALTTTGYGCATSRMDVTTDYDASADFASWRSYDWRLDDISFGSATTTEPAAAQAVEKALRAAIEAQLADKGYVKVEHDPTFRVSYHVAIFEQYTPRREAERALVRDADEMLRRDPIEDLDPDVTRFGTLVIYLYDGRTGKFAWSGTAEGTADSPGDARQKARIAVESILERFPPRP